MGIREITSIIVNWGIMPAIILATFLFSVIIVRRTFEDERGTSTKAGFWAGILLMIVFVISRGQTLKKPTFAFNSLPRLDLERAGIGLFIGFAFLWAVRVLLPTRMVGLISLPLSAASTSGLCTYIFIPNLRGIILFLALGIAFGALLHMILFPSSMKIARDGDYQEGSDK